MVGDINSASILDLIGRIYDAAIEPALWNGVLSGLVGLAAGNEGRATFFIHSVGNPCQNTIGVANLASATLQDYASHWAALDPFVAASEAVPVGRVNYHHETVPDRVLEHSAYLNDWLRPRRVSYRGVNLVLERSARRRVRLALTLEDDNLERLVRPHRVVGLLAPHLMRAAYLHGALAEERQGRDVANAALDQLDLAVVLLRSDGRVAVMNGAAEALLAEGDGVAIQGGKLCSADAAASNELSAAIAKSRGVLDHTNLVARSPRYGFPFSLPRPSGRAAYQVLVSTFSPRLRGIGMLGVTGSQIMVTITDPERRRRAPLEWLESSFRLTSAQLRLAAKLIEGSRLNEAADQLGITIATARSTLKQILAKTQCHSQADLIRLARSAPPFWVE